MDDPCTDKQYNDKGDSESMISAFNFLKSLSYLKDRTNQTTGDKYPARQEIVSNNRGIIND